MKHPIVLLHFELKGKQAIIFQKKCKDVHVSSDKKVCVFVVLQINLQVYIHFQSTLYLKFFLID